MTIKRVGPHYVDSASGITLDCWFPRDNKKIERNCLAHKVGIIRSDFIEMEINDLAVSPKSKEEGYLRLHLLSEYAFNPANSISMEYFL